MKKTLLMIALALSATGCTLSRLHLRNVWMMGAGWFRLTRKC